MFCTGSKAFKKALDAGGRNVHYIKIYPDKKAAMYELWCILLSLHKRPFFLIFAHLLKNWVVIIVFLVMIDFILQRLLQNRFGKEIATVMCQIFVSA